MAGSYIDPDEYEAAQRPDTELCGVCGVRVARVLYGGHLGVHLVKGHALTPAQRLRAAVAIEAGHVAPGQADWDARRRAVDRASRRYRRRQRWLRLRGLLRGRR